MLLIFLRVNLKKKKKSDFGIIQISGVCFQDITVSNLVNFESELPFLGYLRIQLVSLFFKFHCIPSLPRTWIFQQNDLEIFLLVSNSIYHLFCMWRGKKQIEPEIINWMLKQLLMDLAAKIGFISDINIKDWVKIWNWDGKKWKNWIYNI